MKKLIIAVALGAMVPTIARAATCNTAGEYLADDGYTCTSCESGYYCPGDDLKYECPDIENHIRTTFPEQYYDAYITTARIATDWTSGWSSTYNCMAVYWMENSRGTLYEYATYNTVSKEYSNSTNNWGWASTKPGYYLYNKIRCGKYAYYTQSAECPAGAYCPGKDRVECDSKNSAQVFTTYFGRNICPDNTYSDAGASECTPCPAGYVNSGDDLESHAGVASCVPLCTAGATKLRTDSTIFNMYINDVCASPALRVGLSGGTCCVKLSKGHAANAVNIEYDGEIYHTTN